MQQNVAKIARYVYHVATISTPKYKINVAEVMTMTISDFRPEVEIPPFQRMPNDKMMKKTKMYLDQ